MHRVVAGDEVAVEPYDQFEDSGQGGPAVDAEPG